MRWLLICLTALLSTHPVHSQGFGPPTFEPEYVAPTVHKWYGLRHVPETYERPWHYNDTHYGRDQFARYVNRQLEGRELFDSFGNPLGRGWLVYNWQQEQPGPRGSSVDKRNQFSPSFAGEAGISGLNIYDGFFRRLVIANDEGAHRSYRILFGDAIYTRFTPLTFAKPRFNGIRLDYDDEYLAASILFSRPSQPNDDERTHVTSLVGGHGRIQLAPQATLGFTYVNAHNVQTQVEFNQNPPLRGILTGLQNQPLDKLWVRIRDDSPGSAGPGARLASFDIVMVDTTGRTLRGRQIGFLPSIEGGILEGGRLVARDTDFIQLEYDLSSLDFDDIQSDDLRRVTVEVSVANDYRVEVASDLQTDGERFNPEIIFLPVHRANGNVQDNSNSRLLRIDYGLPVATELIGLDWNIVDWHGVSIQGEGVLNRRFSRYPNPAIDHRHQVEQRAIAAYVQSSYKQPFYQLFFEGFTIDHDYSTSYWLTDANGRIPFKNPVPQLYEFVDDDDDFDTWPEWQRPFQGFNEIAWPGFDENLDFLNDHNQNNDLEPDYEEAFLRYRSDRPEFLFGLDLNHNGVIDRFENDALPDYPYKSDHRGYNAYLRFNTGPALEWTFGRQDMELIAGDGHTRAWYMMAAWVYALPSGSRLRLFQHTARVRDTIPDDLIQWFQPIGAIGRMRVLRDLLPAQNSWKNTFYADLDQRLPLDLRLFHRIKWDRLWQLDPARAVGDREGRKRSGFSGLINKAEWSLPVGLAVLEPRWKSEYRRERPFSARLPLAESLEQTIFLLWTQPLLAEQVGVAYFPRYGRQLFSTELQLGLEASRFWLLDGQREEIDQDFTSWTAVAQITNRNAYLGYQLVTRMGLQFIRRNFDTRASQNSSLFFMSVNAGLGD